MDDIRLGRRFTVLRHRLGWRQADVARVAGLSQDVISLVERGRIERVSTRALRRHAHALEADLRIVLDFRGADLDRLADEGHAALVGAVTQRLAGLGWEVRPEVSFSVFGERGSIDIVGWHAESRALLIIEVKTELASVEETLRRHDVKARLAASVVREQFGWQPRVVARLLVLPEGSTPRRQVVRHDAVLRAAYPARGADLGGWLAAPMGSMAGLLFQPRTTGGRRSSPPVRRTRVRVPRARP